MGAAEVAAEHDVPFRRAGEAQGRGGRAQDVARRPEREVDSLGDLGLLVVGVRRELAQRPARVVLRVQRQRRVVLGEALAVGVRGLFFLEVAGVGQHDPRQRHGPRRGVHRPPEAVADQHRQVADVIDVRVGHDRRVDARRRGRAPLPVAAAQFLEPLEQARVDQHPGVGRVDEEPAPGDRARRAQERQHRHLGASGDRAGVGHRHARPAGRSARATVARMARPVVILRRNDRSCRTR